MKHITVLAALLLCAALLAGCGTQSLPPQDSGSSSSVSVSTPDPDPVVSALEAFDGSWYIREEDVDSDGFVILKRFSVDADEQTWTSYDEYGFAGYTGEAHVDSDGVLWIEMDILGNVGFAMLDADTIHEDQSGYTFLRGEDITGPDYAQWEGSWFRSGDKTEDSYTFYGDGTAVFTYTWTGATSDPIKFSWMKSTRSYEFGEDMNSICIEIGEGFNKESLYVSQNGLLMYDWGAHNTTYYVREDAIGTPEGEKTMRLYDLALPSYWTSDGVRISFNENMTVEYLVTGASGYLEAEYYGTWEVTDDGAAITWEDGSEDALHFTSNRAFVMDVLEGEFS